MKKWKKLVAVAVLLVLAVLLGEKPETLLQLLPRVDTPESPTRASVRVIDVVDGDTIKVVMNGVTEKVRFIGVDTPETVHPEKPVECFGKEASNFTKTHLENATITLEVDPSQSDRDKYNRLLRYVFLADGTNFNQLLLQEGYAEEYYTQTPYHYQETFHRVTEQAKQNKAGLWGKSCE